MALISSDGGGEVEPVLLRFEDVDDESEMSPDEIFSSLLSDLMMSESTTTVVERGLAKRGCWVPRNFLRPFGLAPLEWKDAIVVVDALW